VVIPLAIDLSDAVSRDLVIQRSTAEIKGLLVNDLLSQFCTTSSKPLQAEGNFHPLL